MTSAFDTISGSGPNGAIIHYRVTTDSNRTVGTDTLLLVDSGGQYLDGTTDITRTVAVGDPGQAAREAFTRVLQGMIAISRARWPKGLAGRDLDALARYPLWLAGQDYNHGTGHGVGAFLSVHEGPQRLSRLSEVPLEPGMILSNEPGYYREGEWGIRIENLIVVEPAPALPGGDAERQQLAFETLTFVPLDRRLDCAGDAGTGRAGLDRRLSCRGFQASGGTGFGGGKGLAGGGVSGAVGVSTCGQFWKSFCVKGLGFSVNQVERSSQGNGPAGAGLTARRGRGSPPPVPTFRTRWEGSRPSRK